MQGTQWVHLSLEQHGLRYWRDRRGQRDEFFFFFMIYIISGITSEGKAIKIMFTVIVQIFSAIAFGIGNIIVSILFKYHQAPSLHSSRQMMYVLLLLEVILLLIHFLEQAFK